MPIWRRTDDRSRPDRSRPSNETTPRLGILEPEQEPQQRALATSRRTDHRDVRSRRHRQAHAVEHGGQVRAVSERHVAQVDGTAQRRDLLTRSRLRLRTQDLIGPGQHGTRRQERPDRCDRGTHRRGRSGERGLRGHELSDVRAAAGGDDEQHGEPQRRPDGTEHLLEHRQPSLPNLHAGGHRLGARPAGEGPAGTRRTPEAG